MRTVIYLKLHSRCTQMHCPMLRGISGHCVKMIVSPHFSTLSAFHIFHSHRYVQPFILYFPPLNFEVSWADSLNCGFHERKYQFIFLFHNKKSQQTQHLLSVIISLYLTVFINMG